MPSFHLEAGTSDGIDSRQRLKELAEALRKLMNTPAVPGKGARPGGSLNRRPGREVFQVHSGQ